MEQFSSKLQRRGITAFFLLFVANLFAADAPPVTIRDFSPGLVTARDSTIIPDGAASDLENVDVYRGKIEKRKGSAKINTTALGGFSSQSVRFGTEFVDPSNYFWLVSLSSNTLFASSDGGVSQSTSTSGFGLSTTTHLSSANGFGKCYLVSGTTWPITFNGNTWGQITTAPLGSVTAFWSGRLWIANGSVLTGSRVSDDTDWTDNGIDDADAFSATIRNAYGYEITALVPFGPDLMIFTARSLDRLVLNSDGLTFSLVPVSGSLGSLYAETVKETDNDIRWLAHDGVYSFNGSTIKRISEAIQPSIESIQQLVPSGRRYQETSQSQFAAGTSSGTESGVVIDSLVLSTWTATDTSGTDFGLGSLTNVTTQTISGLLQLSTSSVANIANGGFDSGSTSWTITNDGTVLPFTTSSNCRTSTCIEWAEGGSGSYSIPDPLYVAIYDLSGNVLASQRTTDSEGSGYHSHTLDLSAFLGRSVKVGFNVSESGTSATLLSNAFFCVGGVITYYGQTQSVGGFHRQWIDDVTLNVGTNTVGSFVSRTFDTSFQNGAGFFPSTLTFGTNGQNVSFYTQTSADGSAWDARVALSTTTGLVGSTTRRYIRYQVDFSTNAAGTGLPYVSDVTFGARRAYGRYKTPHIFVSGITSWGTFVGNGTANGGSITYEIYTDTDTDMPFSGGVLTRFVSSQTITSGASPTIATNTYVVIGASFSITSATQAPQVDDVSLAWNESDPTVFPASIWWNQGYYLALSVSSQTIDDTIFVYDQNGAWTKYTGLPVRSMWTYRNRPYIGLGGDGYLVRFQEPGTFRDYNGSAISAFWTSKNFDLGYPITGKSLLRYYLTGDALTGSNVTFSYGVDRGTLTGTSYSLNQTGFFKQVVKPSSLTYSEGVQHRFKLSDSTLDGQMTIVSVTGLWRVGTNP